MKSHVAVIITILLSACVSDFAGESAITAEPARGPLRVHPTNPHYFTDGTTDASGSLKVVYLTGSHTWNNLVDMGRDDPPEPFDINSYLDFLKQHDHNFIRLWAWDTTSLDTRHYGSQGKDFVHHVTPHPWMRTGPGQALDGKPKFDLKRFNQDYFERLRTRVQTAGKHGIYVSVMLFEGYELTHGNLRKPDPGWAWRGHPFNLENNINGISATVENKDLIGNVCHLGNPEINAIQTAYIGKVVDTVNDLDNVLYEVINEGGQKDWDWWVIKTIRDHEQTKPKQHPVGLTGHGAERIDDMLASSADWISPGGNDGYGEDPPAWTRQKVSLLDSDHIWGMGGNVAWVWKAFTRGHNPIFMDQYQGVVFDDPSRHELWEEVRRAMGQTYRMTKFMNLAAMSPHDELASTKYCLANPGQEYLVYLPDRGEVTVDLTVAIRPLSVEWFNPHSDEVISGGIIEGGGKRTFSPPFEGDAVLYLNPRAHNKK
jgi:hypothetical protein